MNQNKVIVELIIEKRNIKMDIEIPLNITVYELVSALNETFDLELELTDVNGCHIKAEHPVGIYSAIKRIEECAIMNGTIIRI